VRLFVALEIPSAVRETLAAMIDELRAADAPSSKTKARWVRVESVHVTLKFIGHVDGEKLDAIRGALAEVRSDASVELRFRGLGFFPNDRRARVLWAGVEGSPNLATLADEIDARLAKLGIARETRDFAPHLTLARFDPPGISETLRASAQKNAAREFGSVRTGEFHLFESKTRPTGAEYTRLSSFFFVKGSSVKAEG
jgi:RNA 2',3'-cyclic 3'-phosphodiesterase